MRQRQREVSLRFGSFEVDLRAGQLLKGDRRLRLQDKPFRLLECLLERPGEVISRDEIRQRLWGSDTNVEFDDSLNHAVRKLREALNDSPVKPRYLETIPKRGYRFIGSLQLAPEARPSASAEPPLSHQVGRDSQLSEMQRVFREVESGRGTMLCVSGEPGIGKSTLIDSFLAWASNCGCLVALGRCSERFAGTEAYLPVIESLEGLLARYPECGETLTRKAPAWFIQVTSLDAGDPTLAPVIAEAKAATQERRKREFCAFLQEVSRERPIALFLDDLHWADEFTVDLLAYAASRCGSMRVLLGGTFRPSDLALAQHPFEQVRLELQARRLYQEIVPPQLSGGDIQQYLDVEFPSNRFPALLPAWLHEHTEGMPLFLVDLLRDLHGNGVIKRAESGWVLAQALPDRASAPDSIRSMVRRKLSKLSPEDRRLLETASTQGSEFRSVAVSAALGMSEQQLQERLQDLEATHHLVVQESVEELPGSTISLRYRFAHALYQNALFDGLSPGALIALSNASALALESAFGGESRRVASEIAYLFEAAREWDRAAHYFLLAATAAAARQANPTVIALSQRAIRSAERLSGRPRDERVLNAALQLSRAHQAMSQFPEAIAGYELAEAAANRIGDTGGMVEAAMGLGTCLFCGRNVARLALEGRRLWEAAEARQSSLGTAGARFLLAHEAFILGKLNVMRDHLDEVMPVLEKARLGTGYAIAAGFRAFLHTLQSEYVAAEPLFVQALDQARDAGVAAEVIRILWQRGIALANRGLFDQACEFLQEGWRLAELNQEAYWITRFPNTLGWLYDEILDYKRSLALNTEGVAISRQVGFPEAEANSHINLAILFCRSGELEKASGHLDEGERLLNQQDEKVWFRWRFNIRLREAQAIHHLRRGELAQARLLAREALERAAAVKARKHVALTHRIAGDIAVAENRREEALDCYLAGLAALEGFPCPLVEWKLLAAAADSMPAHASAAIWRSRALEILTSLARGIGDPARAQSFLELARLAGGLQ